DRDLFSVLVYNEQVRNGVPRDFLFEFQAFQFAHPAIIPEENGARPVAVHDNVRDKRLKAVGRLDEALNDQAVSVAIDNPSGQKVALAVDPPAEKRIDAQSLAQTIGQGETLLEERLIDSSVAAAQKTKRDLRLRAEERLAQNRVAFIANGNDAAGLGVFGIDDVAAVEPRMTAADAVRSAPANDDLARWAGGRWAGRRWAGRRWAGRRWAGRRWAGRRWAGRRWAGRRWAGRRWAGRRWAGRR